MTKAIALIPILFAPLVAQDPPTVDAAKRREVVAGAGRLLTERYVFADKGDACATLLQERLDAGAYDAIDDASAFAQALTRDLQNLTHDKHLRVLLQRPERRGRDVDRAEVERRSGTDRIPVVRTPEGWFLDDSTALALLFERLVPEVPILPPTPAQRIACLLIEDWVDEWLARAALHFRWCHEPDRGDAVTAIAHAFAGVPPDLAAGRADRALVHRIERRLPGCQARRGAGFARGNYQGETRRTAMTKTEEQSAESMIRFRAHGVTSTESIEVQFQRSTPVDAVARSLAEMMAMPADIPWGLRDDGSSVYLDDRPIGDQIQPDAAVSLTPKTHLGGSAW